MNNSTEPAFPQSKDWLSKDNNGMSKRFYAACAAMTGIMANSYFYKKETEALEDIDDAIEWFSLLAYNIADELLRQENE
jgi:hypothetical protein